MPGRTGPWRRRAGRGSWRTDSRWVRDDERAAAGEDHLEQVVDVVAAAQVVDARDVGRLRERVDRHAVAAVVARRHVAGERHVELAVAVVVDEDAALVGALRVRHRH
eukprot:CAMPEP_0198308152 /NCGR_PEP_ID=MMETSP1450-20131203/906_1 /TAXON_ID=753684 ORGANISM="Madagascaria erythrocladiodes, Strain CCMP3234" /NCGR_SAMPLE_ID=MMETSP1450 /ASSEMBLY_ACC=CAM_ASM_001115 /LENGTH=106 /DNA_ID=CAMNT_0044010793 /DNA_START=67 /DNA_END=384 /DNA_ORIENTATION=-